MVAAEHRLTDLLAVTSAIVPLKCFDRYIAADQNRCLAAGLGRLNRSRSRGADCVDLQHDIGVFSKGKVGSILRFGEETSRSESLKFALLELFAKSKIQRS